MMLIFEHFKSAPWTIKASIVLFACYMIMPLFSLFWWQKLNIFVVLILLVEFALLYGFIHKIAWARDILVGLSLIIIVPVLMALLSTFVVELNNVNLLSSTMLFNCLPLIAGIFAYTKRSQLWFKQYNEIPHEDSPKMLWAMQLALVLFSMGLGWIAIIMDASFHFPFLKGEHLSFIASYPLKRVIFYLHSTFGLLCAWCLTIVPFGFVIGMWKNYNLMLLTRLMSLGILVSLIFNDVVLGSTLNNDWIFLFIFHAFLASYLIYFSLSIGRRFKKYFMK